MNINENMTLADVVKEYPQTIPYLNELHLDYCCGGHDPIHVLAREKKMDQAELLAKLNELAEKAVNRNTNTADSINRFRELSVSEMLDDLESTHHITERKLMNEAEAYLDKILVVHYPHHGELLTRLHHLYMMLEADLKEHFAKEERLIFPIMRENPTPDFDQVNAVKELEEEHSKAGDLIKKIQELTNHFTLPNDACASFAHTYEVMEQLFEDIFVHIFKENSVAFPEYYEKMPHVAEAPGACGCGEAFGKTFCGSEAESVDKFKEAADTYAEEIFHNTYTGGRNA